MRFEEVAPLVVRLEAFVMAASAMSMVSGGTAGTESQCGDDDAPADDGRTGFVDEPVVPVERDEEDLELLVEFLDESFDEIDRCEEVLNELTNGNNEFLGEFRKFHSIKGVASRNGRHHQLDAYERSCCRLSRGA